MTAVPALPMPSALWKGLSPARRQQAAEAFWSDEDAPAEQTEAIMLIAQRIKFRPKSVQALPRDRRVRYLAGLGAVSELVAARLLVAYHLAHQRPMMSAFLDALGIRHENGLIADENLEAPASERLREAARMLAASHPAEDVSLYLATLVWQDPETWGELAEAPEVTAGG